VQYSVMAEVRASAWAHPPTEELFLIILMHMMNKELIPGRKKRV